MSLLQNSNAISAGGYDVNNSLRFRSSASAYLSRTPASAGSQTTWTMSLWVKRGTLTTRQDVFGIDNSNCLSFQTGGSSGDNLAFELYNGAGADYYVRSTAVYRDPSAWYHIVAVWDSSNATATDRQRLYVNGQRITAFTSGNAIPLNATSNWNNTNAHSIGRNTTGGFYFDGYLAEINFIDGQALTPSSFGATDATTGVWQPAKYTGTYGTNGFYLKFSDIATTSGSNAGLGKDFSGNTNYWTTNNISVTAGTTYDAMTDSPTNTSATVANYAVLNPIYSTSYAGNVLAANLQINSPTTDGFCPSTIAVSSGKWYYEAAMTNSTAASFLYGIVKTTAAQAELRNVGTGNGYSYLASTGVKSDGSGGAGTAYGATFTTGDVMGCAFDLDSGSITFYKNGVSQGVAYTGISGEFMAAIGDAAGGSGGQTAAVNFGQRPFSYTPPTGYVALNTFNLPTPTILQGNKYMDATLYTGTGATQTITNAGGFKPDLVWIKARSIAYFHRLSDSVRGIGKELYSNDTGAETTNQVDGWVSAFNSNGFSILGGAGVNLNANTFVGWQWQAGQGTTSSNTSGSLTSTVSVNTTAGFSIVTYTGTGANATVGHGLGVAPKMVIIKNRTAGSTAWNVYQASIPSGNLLSLNSTAASFANTNRITAVSSTTFSIGTDSDVNGSTNSHVAYCWAEIAGFSKFGSYTGNGSADGPMIFTGFNPKYWLVKRTDSADDWFLFDSARDPYNIIDLRLSPNASYAEASTTTGFDFLANGVKVRSSSTAFNASGGTYIYAAFAENPFKNANAR